MPWPPVHEQSCCPCTAAADESFPNRPFGAHPEDKFRLCGDFCGAGHRRVDKMNLPAAASAAIFFENDGLTELQSTQSAFGRR